METGPDSEKYWEDLAAARASRSKAELERRRIYHEALEATKEASEQLIAEAERQLERAKKAEAESDKKRAKVEEELKQAQLARAESDSYREKSVAEADSYCEKVIAEADSYREKVATEAQQESQLEAQRIREEARAAALQECNELKRHVTNEVQAILDEIEAIRGAAEEELEAQRIYAETANIKAMTHDVRTNVVESVEAVFGQDRALAEDSPSVDMEEPVVEAQAAQPGPEARVNGSSEQAGETSTAKSSRSKSSR